MLTLLLACSPLVSIELAPTPPCTRCALTDENQYRLEAEISVEELHVVPGADVLVDFSGLTEDLQGHPIDAAVDVDQASLFAFRGLEPLEIRERLVSNELAQSDIAGWLTAFPETTSVALSEFGTMGNKLDAPHFFVAGTTWMVALQANQGRTASSLLFLIPDARASVEAVAMENDTSHLRAEVDFLALSPVTVASDVPDLVLDWADVATDGFGHPFANSSVTQLLLARFNESPESLSSAVLDLEGLAEETWTMELGGSSWANLGSLRGETEFVGVYPGSTWVMMLRSEDSMNPAPYLLTRLEGAP